MFSPNQQQNPFNVFRYYYMGQRTQSYSSWFPYGGGIIGAAHSDETFENNVNPPFALGSEINKPGGLDAVAYNVTFPEDKPRQFVVDDLVRLYGFPAGSEAIAVREGRVLMERPGGGSWITVFDDGEELAVGGMSGGAVSVVLPNGEEVLSGIIVTQNSAADVDFDGDKENGADVVSLRDVWNVVKSIA